jgi:hypothetical protein
MSTGTLIHSGSGSWKCNTVALYVTKAGLAYVSNCMVNELPEKCICKQGLPEDIWKLVLPLVRFYSALPVTKHHPLHTTYAAQYTTGVVLCGGASNLLRNPIVYIRFCCLRDPESSSVPRSRATFPVSNNTSFSLILPTDAQMEVNAITQE